MTIEQELLAKSQLEVKRLRSNNEMAYVALVVMSFIIFFIGMGNANYSNENKKLQSGYKQKNAEVVLLKQELDKFDGIMPDTCLKVLK